MFIFFLKTNKPFILNFWKCKTNDNMIVFKNKLIFDIQIQIIKDIGESSLMDYNTL